MPMGHKAVVLIVFGLALLAPAGGAAAETWRETAPLPTAWLACQTADDCGLAPVPCDRSRAVRIDRRTAAIKLISQAFGPFAGCDHAVLDDASAICRHGQCRIIRDERGQAAGIPASWRHCMAAGDCALVPLTCYPQLAVRQDRLAATQTAMLKTFGHNGACNGEEQAPQAAQCAANRCVAQDAHPNGPVLELNNLSFSSPTCITGPCLPGTAPQK